MSFTGVDLNKVIVPEIFNKYVSTRVMEENAFIKSGIVINSAEYDALASSNAYNVNMPFFKDLTGDSVAIVEGADLTAKDIGSGKVIAPILRRAAMWASTDLSAALAGVDPLKEIADKVAAFWDRDLNKELIAILNGIFGTTGSKESGTTQLAANIHDISAKSSNNTFSAKEFINAEQKLGDAKSQLTAVAMNSATHSLLRIQNLIDTVRASDNTTFDTYMGKRVIVDDAIPVSSTGVTTTYLFGSGAFGYGNGNPVNFKATEIDRDKKKGSGVDYLINRKTYILQPNGVSFTGTPTNAEGVTRTELESAANWTKQYDTKNIKIVAFKHKIS